MLDNGCFSPIVTLMSKPKRITLVGRIVQISVLIVICLLLYNGSMYIVETVYRDDDENQESDTNLNFNSTTVMDWEWAQWQGPNRDSRSAETNLLKSWPKHGPNLIWKNNDTGQGWSSPTIAGGYVYVTGTKNKKEFLVCLDLAGQFKWKIIYGSATYRYSGARSTPAYDKGNVYVISGIGEVVCIDTRKSMIVWKLNAYKIFQGECGNFGIAESPLVVDDKVIYTPCGKQTTMVALDKLTGETIWKSESVNDVSAYVSPTIIERGGRKIILTVTGSYIVGIDPEKGEILWKYLYVKNDKRENLLGTLMANVTTPLYHDGQIYVTSGYNQGGVALELSENGRSVQVIWEDKILDCHHGGVVYHNGYVYGSSWRNNADGNWVCINWKTGEVMYDHHWFDKGSIVYADDMLYCYEEEQGHVALIKATPGKFDIVSSFRVSTEKGENWTHPVICDGRLYMRYKDALLAYDVKQK